MNQRWQTLLGLVIILVSLGFSTNAKADLTGNLTVEVDGLKNQKGQICFSLFASSRGFPDQRQSAIVANCVKIASPKPKLSFTNLKAGSYAVAVFHDVQGNGSLKRNSLGIPTAGFGFSNNPSVVTGAPKFGDSAVFVAGPQTDIQINLLYLFGS
jgi:uncharacterized protein (DUF2141 family)